MKYAIEIDDASTIKKGIIEMLKEVAKKHKGIHVRKLTKKEIEAREDAGLFKMMEEGRKSGLADTKKVLKKLGLEWS